MANSGAGKNKTAASPQKQKNPSAQKKNVGSATRSKSNNNNRGNTSGKKTASAQKGASSRGPEYNTAKKQIVSSVIFTVGLLLLAIAVIPGTAPDQQPNLWQHLRNIIFGLFGVCSFALPIMLLYSAVALVRDRPLNSITGKLVGSVCAVTGFSSFLHLAMHSSDYLTLTRIGEQAAAAWAEGLKAANGGAAGAVFGGGLASLFGKGGAVVTILILLFLVLMLLTGTSIERLFEIIRVYFGKTTDYTANRIKTAEEKRRLREMTDDISENGESFVEESAEYRRKNRVKDGGRNYKTPKVENVLDPKKANVPFDYDFGVVDPDNSERVEEDDGFENDIPGFKAPPMGKLTVFAPLGVEDELSKQREGFNNRQTATDSENQKEAGAKTAEDDVTDISDDSVINGFIDVDEDEDNIDAGIINEAAEKAAALAAESANKANSVEIPIVPTSSQDPDLTDKREYELPEINCLVEAAGGTDSDIREELNATSEKLRETLRSFNIETTLVGISRGPSVTRYEIQPAPGIKISRIAGLADDISMNLASSGVRIEAPIPNKAAVGVEVPNKNSTMVSLREIVDSNQYKSSQSKLTVALGKDISGNVICTDLAKMPHLLIAGTTGSGKSVCLNSMIVSILFNSTPDEVKMILIDPKQVEFTVYNGIPHLLVPVVSDPRKAAGALGWAVAEMLRRYKLFSEYGVRDFKGYNKLAAKKTDLAPMHQIVIFIDELADLMMVAQNEVEDSICRLAQMARAAGMHLVIATQRPSVDVITGIIKANIPSRIALYVSSAVDSRTILDMSGAEKLLGNGDMLFNPVGVAKPVRIQGCFVSDEEVERVVDFIKNQREESEGYDEEIIDEIEKLAAAEKKKGTKTISADDSPDSGADDETMRAIAVVVENQLASTTLLQRKLKIGYAKAARIMDELEEKGVIGPFEGSKPRKVLMSKQQFAELRAVSDSAAQSSSGNGGEL